MREVETEKVSTLIEEIEGKLFHVSFVNYKEENSRKRVFAETSADFVVEKTSKNEGKYKVDNDGSW